LRREGYGRKGAKWREKDMNVYRIEGRRRGKVEEEEEVHRRRVAWGRREVKVERIEWGQSQKD
jgi:hypothetical protein